MGGEQKLRVSSPRGLAILTLTILSTLLLSASVTIPPGHGVTWSAGTNLTPPLSLESKPYVILDDKGVLWLTYDSSRSSNFDIYSRRLNGSQWTAEERLTTDSSSDQGPAIAQMTNGTLLLVWSSDRSGEYSLYSKRLNAGVWSSETRVTTGPGRDSTPSIVQSRNGTLWLFWTRTTVSGNKAYWDVYYKTYTDNLWSPERPFLTTVDSELHQSVFESDDGAIWALYTSDKSGNYDLYYKTYRTTWSAETRLTTNADDDRQGWIMQDYNGTMWVFWSRCVSSGSSCQDDVFYRSSSNQGASWVAETKFTIDPVSDIFDTEPAAIHAKDKRLYLFWTTNLTGNGAEFDIYYSTSNPIPIHDVGILGAAAGPTTVERGTQAHVNVTAANPGDYSETLSVTALYENATSSSMTAFDSTIISLLGGRSSNLQLTWDTTNIAPAEYKILVTVQPVPGESLRRQNDNLANAGNVSATPRILIADIDRNGRVDILDAAILALHFGQTMGPEDTNHDCSVNIIDAATVAIAFGSTPGSPNWIATADVDGNGKVDIVDAARIAARFGAVMPPGDLDNDCDVDILDAATLAFWYGTVA